MDANFEPLPERPEEDLTISQDAEEARKNIKQLIETGTDAIEHAVNVAVQSESPRAFEVVSNMLNTLANLNTLILDTHAKQKKIEADSRLPGPNTPQKIEATQNNTTNIMFKGTPAQLAAFLADSRKENKE